MDDLNKNTEPSSQGIELKKYIFKAVSYWYLFVISLAVSVFIAKWVNKHAIPTYGLHATVMLIDESQEEELAGGLSLFSKRKNLNTQIGILKSFSLSEEAVRELNFDISYYRDERFKDNYEIYKNSPFVVNFDTSFHQYTGIPVYVIFKSKEKVEIKIEEFEFEKEIRLGEQFVYHDFSFNITMRDTTSFNPAIIGNKYFFTKNNLTYVVQNYLGRLEIEVSPEQSSIMWLWLIGSVPHKDADYLNKLIEIYIRKGLEEKNQKALGVIKFIDEQLEGVSDSLQETESTMQLFKQQNKTIDISNEGMLLLNQLTELRKLFEDQQKKLSYYQYLSEQVESGTNENALVAPSVMNINDPVLLGYMDNLSKVVTDREVLDYNVKSDIPVSEKLDLQISKIKNQILFHSKKNIEVTKSEIDKIKHEINKVNADINRLPVSERQIINIERKFNINDEIYTLLLRRRTEAAITQASNKPDTKMLDAARWETADRKSPDTAGNTRKGILFGLLIPIMIIVLLEFFNNKIDDKSDIESRTSIPIYGTIGKNKHKSNLPVITSPKSPISESFRAIRTNLQYILKSKDKKILAVTSSISGEGKSFISSNLAGVLAISQKKTLLVGLDLRKPKLHLEFNKINDLGISNYLVENAEYHEIIKKTEIENLDVAFSGPVPPNPAELIESERMKLFFEQAVKDYDYIIVDTPPIAVVTDALLLTNIADAYLYIMRQNYSSKNVIKLIEDVKKDNALQNLGIILNEVEIKRGYGYSYGYGYGYGYGLGQGYYDDSLYQQKTLYQKFIYYLKKFKR
jgi:capsular exopolysaccharide synthesis family protein